MKIFKNKFFINLILVLMVAGASYGGWYYFQNQPEKSGYHAVYMTSGDIYFGRLKKFPHLALGNAYTLQRNPGNTETPFNLVKFDDVFWGPEDILELNSANVLWIVELENDSQVVQYVQGKIQPVAQ